MPDSGYVTDLLVLPSFLCLAFPADLLIPPVQRFIAQHDHKKGSHINLKSWVEV